MKGPSPFNRCADSLFNVSVNDVLIQRVEPAAFRLPHQKRSSGEPGGRKMCSFYFGRQRLQNRHPSPDTRGSRSIVSPVTLKKMAF